MLASYGKKPFLLALIGVVVGFYASSAEAQSTDVHTHVNLVERDKQAIDSELTGLEAHMSNAASAMDATLNGEREALEASFEAARQALELAIGNAYLARDDAERFQEWSEGRLSDAELAQSQTTAEANALYNYADRAEQAASDAELDRSGEIGLLHGAVSSARSSANLATTAATSASNAAREAADLSAEALAWRNRAQAAFQRANDDVSLADAAKRAAETARDAAQLAESAAEQALDSAQNLVASAAALRALLIDRANQAADDANKIADDVETVSLRYQAMSSLLATVQGNHDSYLAKLIWAENNIPDFCAPDLTTLVASINSGIKANGSDYSTITGRLNFADGSPAQGQVINFSTNLGNLSAASATTNVHGQASVRLSSTRAGTSTVTATYRGASQRVNVGFVTPPPTYKWVRVTGKILPLVSDRGSLLCLADVFAAGTPSQFKLISSTGTQMGHICRATYDVRTDHPNYSQLK